MRKKWNRESRQRTRKEGSWAAAPRRLVAIGVDGCGSDVSALPGPTFRLTLTALCGESALPLTSSFKNQNSTFINHHSSILPRNTPMATSGRTTAGQPYRFKSSAPHPAEPELPSARAKLRALRSAERRPWALPLAPLSPVPPEVEPYL